LTNTTGMSHLNVVVLTVELCQSTTKCVFFNIASATTVVCK